MKKGECYCGLPRAAGAKCLHGAEPGSSLRDLRRTTSVLRKREKRAGSRRSGEYIKKSEARAAWGPPVDAFPFRRGT